MGSKETHHQKRSVQHTGHAVARSTYQHELKRSHSPTHSSRTPDSHPAAHRVHTPNRADLQKEQSRKAKQHSANLNQEHKVTATKHSTTQPHIPTKRSITPASPNHTPPRTNLSRFASAPSAVGVVTEAQLVAKERMIASLRESKRQAERSKASRGFFDGGGRAADTEDIKRFGQLITLGETSWQRMWNKRYLASKPEHMPAKQAVIRQLDKLQAVASKNVTHGLTEFDKTIAKAEYKRDLVQKLYASVKKDQDDRGFMERTFYFRDVNQRVDHIKGLLQKHDNYVAKLHNKRSSLLHDYFAFVTYLSEGRTTISRQSEFKANNGAVPKIEVKPVRSFNSAFSALAQAFDSFREFTIDAHAKQRLAPAERNAKLTHSAAISIEKQYDDLNLLEKAFAGDARKNIRFSNDLAKQYAIEAENQEEQHRRISQEFNSFAAKIAKASSALAQGKPLSFIVRSARSGSNAAAREHEYTIDFSETGISSRLGLSKRVLVIGAFTRKNEGSPDPDSRHFEGKIHWPRYASGVTLAGGYDIGYKSKSTVKSDLLLADKALRVAGKAEIPQVIKSQLLQGVGKHGTAARDFLNQHAALKAYRFEKEATTVFFHQYFKRELATAERVVNKNMGDKVFRRLPVEVQALIADTVTRGDFKSLRNSHKRQAFYGAVREGATNGDWSDLADIYSGRKVFTLNPKIDRHKIRAGLAREIENKYGAGEG